MSKSNVDLWANFLANEKLTPARVEDPMLLVKLCEKLAETGGPRVKPYAAKLISRRRVVNQAMDLGIDLAALKDRGKLIMSRGLLDIWNSEYAKRYGSNVGTAAWKEAKRRDIKTLLRSEKPSEKSQKPS